MNLCVPNHLSFFLISLPLSFLSPCSINNTLGEGQFGFVNKGLWTSPDGRHDVAVKMLKPDATEEDRVKLLQEAAIMGQFSHQNIVKLYGVVTIGEPVS